MNQILKKIVPVIAGVCSLGAGAWMTGEGQYLLWNQSVTDGYYNNPVNWLNADGTPANAVPDGTHYGIVGSGAQGESTPYTLSDITIRIPAGGLSETSGTYLSSPFDKNGNRTITIDARGTFWEKAAATYNGGCGLLFYKNEGKTDVASAVENGCLFKVSRSAGGTEKMFTLTDGLIRFESIAGATPTYNICLDSGTWDLAANNFSDDWAGHNIFHNLFLGTNTSFRASNMNLASRKAVRIEAAGGNHVINTLKLKSSQWGGEHDTTLVAYGDSKFTTKQFNICTMSTGNSGTATVVVSNNASVVAQTSVYLGGDGSSTKEGNTGRLYVRDDAKFVSDGNLTMATMKTKDKIATGLVEVSDRGKFSAKNILMSDTVGGVASITVNDDAVFEFGNITGETAPSADISTSVTVNNANLTVRNDLDNAIVTKIDSFAINGDVNLEVNGNVTFDQNISGTGNLIVSGAALATFNGACSYAKTTVSKGGKIKFGAGASVSGQVELCGDNLLSFGDNAVMNISCLNIADEALTVSFKPGAKLVLNEVVGSARKLDVVLEGNFAAGEHDLITFAQGTVCDAGAIDGVILQDGKTCSLQIADGVLKAVVSNAATGTFAWTGNANDGKWETVANWNMNGSAATRIPSLNDEVSFSIGNAGMTVTCDEIAFAGKIVVNGSGTSSGLTISGSGRMMIANEEAFAANSAVVNVGLPVLFYKANAKLQIPAGGEISLNGALSCFVGKVVVTKEGFGKLAIAGDNRGLLVDWVIPNGYNTFRGPYSFGVDTDSNNGLVLSNNTLRYEGEAASIKRKINFVSKEYPIHIKTVGDLRFREFVGIGAWPCVHAYVKTGVGTLTFELNNSSSFFTGNIPNSGPNMGDQGNFIESEDGVISSTDGLFGALTILEGTLHMKGEGKNAMTITFPDCNNLVGGSGYVAQKSPELFLEDLNAARIIGSYRVFSVGRKLPNGSAQPKIRLVNSVMGAGAGGLFNFAEKNHTISQEPLCPSLVMTNSVVETFNNNVVNAGTNYIHLTNNSIIRRASQSTALSKTYFILDGSSRAEFSGSGAVEHDLQVTLRKEDADAGFLMVRDGSVIRTARYTGRTVNWGGNKTKHEFDGGILELTAVNETNQFSWCDNPGDGNGFYLHEKGMTISIPDGLTHRMAIPLRGEGVLRKSGGGTCVFGNSMFGTGKDIDYTCFVLQNSGGLIVEAGEAVIHSNNVITVADYPVAVNAGATLSLNDQAFTLTELSGCGTVRNGELSFSEFKYDAAAGLPMTFDNMTINGNVNVDFGVTEGNGYDFGTVFTVAKLVDTTCNVRWKGVNVGEKRKIVFKTTASGDIIGEVASSAGMTIIIR